MSINPTARSMHKGNIMIKRQYLLIFFFTFLFASTIYAQAKAPLEINVPGTNGETVFTYQLNTSDPVMKRVPAATLAQRQKDPNEFIRLLAAYITTNATSEYDKVKKAHDWVALNIKYDVQSFLSGRYQSQAAGAVLRRGLAVCAGYADVFNMLCDALKIECIIVNGYARGYGSAIFKYEDPNDSNHAWNIVTIAGNKYLIDITWDSGSVSGGNFLPKYKTEYLFTDPEYFINEHFPSDRKHQLLDPPITAEAFDALPFINPVFYQIAEINQKLKRITEVTVEEDTAPFSLEIILKPEYELIYGWYKDGRTRVGRGDNYPGRKDQYQITMPALKPGNYSLRLWVRRTGERSSEYCGEFGFVVK